MNSNIYPRSNDFQTIYLNTVIKNPAIIVGDYTIYNDFVNDPVLFEKNNVFRRLTRNSTPRPAMLLEAPTAPMSRSRPCRKPSTTP